MAMQTVGLVIKPTYTKSVTTGKAAPAANPEVAATTVVEAVPETPKKPKAAKSKNTKKEG